MYIAVLDRVPDHMVPVLVAHATLGAHLAFYRPTGYGDDPEYNSWLHNSFRKVVLKVNTKEFDKIKVLPDVYLAHENTVLNGEKTCAVVCPRKEYPRVIQFAKMWKPNDTEVANRLTIRAAQLEKQVSDYGWEQDQNSPYRMGL